MTEDFKRKLTAILSADVVGYSRLMGDDEETTVRTLNKYKEIIFELIQRNNGRVIDSPGDNVLAEFASVVDAVRCGVQIQEDLKGHNDELPLDRKMEFRIGIHTGDVIQDGDRIYGDGVNVAARIESLADPGGICISGTAYDQVKNKINIEYEYLGEHEVKNIKEPVKTYRILMGSKSPEKAIADDMIHRGISTKRNGVIALIIVAACLIAWFGYSNKFKNIETASVEPEKALVSPEVKEAPKTIAVLPFDDLSPKNDQEYFVLGLSEEILNSLTKISGLHVTSKTSSFAFKNTDKTIQEIAEILDRDYILEGSVRKDGSSLRITTQLIHVEDDRHIWSETYDRKIEDIFKIQEDIADNVAEKLKLTLEAFQLLGGTENVNAYELYLSANGIDAGDDPSKWKGAIKLFDEAIALDPRFALAYVQKAHSHIQLAGRIPINRIKSEYNALTHAVDTAIDIEPKLGRAYILKCTMSMNVDWIEAENYCRRAIELLNGNITGDDNFLPAYYLAVGNFGKAHEIFKQMMKNDPLNKWYQGFYILNLAFLGDIQEAEEEYELHNKKFGSYYFTDLTISAIRLGHRDALTQNDIVYSNPIFDLGKKYIDSPEEGLIKLRDLYNKNDVLTRNNLDYIAIWAAYFGDSEFAMEVIEEREMITFFWLKVFEAVRKLPRFKEFVRNYGLVDYWKEYGWPDLCRPVGNDDFECD